ncbi:MAG: nucleotidyltransferase family protein [Lachnospiraceae bacterium]|nr:nucleotidyltransferase family protein [Lachnospiraceae bacterium]
MKIAAVIAEFNPFHNGHAHLIREIREKCDADYVVAIISGDFVQRGIPAVCDKFTRSEAAVRCGVDAVFELPAVFASSAAPDFSFGGVSAVNAMNCIDVLGFGSECGDISRLQKAADLLSNETPGFKESLKAAMKEGLSYPAALSEAATTKDPSLKALLRDPNNTLAIEYIKALKKLDSPILPYTVPRHLSAHGEEKILKDSENGLSYTGATYIRNCLLDIERSEELKACVPEGCSSILLPRLNREFPVRAEDFSLPLSVMLEKMTEDEITALPGNPSLKEKLKKHRKEFLSFTDLKLLLRDKSVTDAAVSRFLIHALLSLKETDIDRTSGTSYLRLLAMKKEASPLLKQIKEKASVPVITKMADFDIDACTMLQKDICAADLYEKVRAAKFGTLYKNDIIHSPVIV